MQEHNSLPIYLQMLRFKVKAKLIFFVFFFFSNRSEKWSRTSGNTFSFSKQTKHALVRILHTQSCLITDLYEEGFIFVIPRRFQIDPLENRVAEYRQMSGGRFLVSLREVKSSEKSLLIPSLTKENTNFPEEKFQS